MIILAGSVSLAGCGTQQVDRGISGAGIGAAIGTGVGAISGLSLLEGAVIGTAVGGITALATNPNQVNFGEPVWRRYGLHQRSPGKGKVGPSYSSPSGYSQPASGYSNSPSYSTPSTTTPSTTTPSTNYSSPPSYSAPAPAYSAPAPAPTNAYPADRLRGQTDDPQTVRDIQLGLSRLGYDPGPANGVVGPKTADAIKSFQQRNGLATTGQPSPNLTFAVHQR
jgi:hypothetical protein